MSVNKSLLVKQVSNTKFSLLSFEKLEAILSILQSEDSVKKVCPFCGYHRLAEFSSRQEKVCLNCYKKIPWKLGEKEKPLVLHQR